MDAYPSFYREEHLMPCSARSGTSAKSDEIDEGERNHLKPANFVKCKNSPLVHIHTVSHHSHHSPRSRRSKSTLPPRSPQVSHGVEQEHNRSELCSRNTVEDQFEIENLLRHRVQPRPWLDQEFAEMDEIGVADEQGANRANVLAGQEETPKESNCNKVLKDVRALLLK